MRCALVDQATSLLGGYWNCTTILDFYKVDQATSLLCGYWN